MIQVIICHCGKHIAAHSEPGCYEDKAWHKTLRKAAKKEMTIKMIKDKTELNFGHCECLF